MCIGRKEKKKTGKYHSHNTEATHFFIPNSILYYEEFIKTYLLWKQKKKQVKWLQEIITQLHHTNTKTIIIIFVYV